MSGIYRDVYLFARPKEHIRDYFVKESFNDGFAQATVTVELELSGACSVTGTLYAPGGEKVGEAASTGEPLVFQLENPLLWNAEQPNQYDLVLSTGDEVMTWCSPPGMRSSPRRWACGKSGWTTAWCT